MGWDFVLCVDRLSSLLVACHAAFDVARAVFVRGFTIVPYTTPEAIRSGWEYRMRFGPKLGSRDCCHPARAETTH